MTTSHSHTHHTSPTNRDETLRLQILEQLFNFSELPFLSFTSGLSAQIISWLKSSYPELEEGTIGRLLIEGYVLLSEMKIGAPFCSEPQLNYAHKYITTRFERNIGKAKPELKLKIFKFINNLTKNSSDKSTELKGTDRQTVKELVTEWSSDHLPLLMRDFESSPIFEIMRTLFTVLFYSLLGDWSMSSRYIKDNYYFRHSVAKRAQLDKIFCLESKENTQLLPLFAGQEFFKLNRVVGAYRVFQMAVSKLPEAKGSQFEFDAIFKAFYAKIYSESASIIKDLGIIFGRESFLPALVEKMKELWHNSETFFQFLVDHAPDFSSTKTHLIQILGDLEEYDPLERDDISDNVPLDTSSDEVTLPWKTNDYTTSGYKVDSPQSPCTQLMSLVHGYIVYLNLFFSDSAPQVFLGRFERFLEKNLVSQSCHSDRYSDKLVFGYYTAMLGIHLNFTVITGFPIQLPDSYPSFTSLLKEAKETLGQPTRDLDLYVYDLKRLPESDYKEDLIFYLKHLEMYSGSFHNQKVLRYSKFQWLKALILLYYTVHEGSEVSSIIFENVKVLTQISQWKIKRLVIRPEEGKIYGQACKNEPNEVDWEIYPPRSRACLISIVRPPGQEKFTLTKYLLSSPQRSISLHVESQIQFLTVKGGKPVIIDTEEFLKLLIPFTPDQNYSVYKELTQVRRKALIQECPSSTFILSISDEKTSQITLTIKSFTPIPDLGEIKFVLVAEGVREARLPVSALERTMKELDAVAGPLVLYRPTETTNSLDVRDQHGKYRDTETLSQEFDIAKKVNQILLPLIQDKRIYTSMTRPVATPILPKDVLTSLEKELKRMTYSALLDAKTARVVVTPPATLAFAPTPRPAFTSSPPPTLTVLPEIKNFNIYELERALHTLSKDSNEIKQLGYYFEEIRSLINCVAHGLDKLIVLQKEVSTMLKHPFTPFSIESLHKNITKLNSLCGEVENNRTRLASANEVKKGAILEGYSQSSNPTSPPLLRTLQTSLAQLKQWTNDHTLNLPLPVSSPVSSTSSLKPVKPISIFPYPSTEPIKLPEFKNLNTYELEAALYTLNKDSIEIQYLGEYFEEIRALINQVVQDLYKLLLSQKEIFKTLKNPLTPSSIAPLRTSISQLNSLGDEVEYNRTRLAGAKEVKKGAILEKYSESSDPTSPPLLRTLQTSLASMKEWGEDLRLKLLPLVTTAGISERTRVYPT